MKLGNVAMVLVTIAAAVVMYFQIRKQSGDPKPSAKTDNVQLAAPVSIHVVTPENDAIRQRYSGMIRPFERMTLGFEIPGRIEELGKNANQQSFDDGIRVAAGDSLAKLDTRELEARKAEADALLEQAKREMERADGLRQRNDRAISESDYLSRQTSLRIAQAQANLAEERLRDATLVSPFDGVVSKRWALQGESINAHQPIFELIQVDKVLLVVGVPESKIRPILKRFNDSRRLSAVGAPNKPFQADVQLVGRDDTLSLDPAGGSAPESLTGVVVTVSETSDDKSGLFEVEIEIPNEKHQLRPGQIAVAALIVKEVTGVFKIPSHAAIFEPKINCECEEDDRPAVAREEWGREDVCPQCGKRIQFEDGFVYYVDADSKAQRLSLEHGRYLEQNGQLLVANLPVDKRRIVVQGQHRLTPERLVVITGPQAQSDESESGVAASPVTAKSEPPAISPTGS